MARPDNETARPTGGAPAPPAVSPSANSLRWLIILRLVVVSTLFLGVLIIQVNTQLILQLKYIYGLILLTYGLSLLFTILYIWKLNTRLQAVLQLIGDIGIVTGIVYFTGGLYSPFSFLYLTVIVTAAVMLRGGGLIFAGLSAVTYGVLVDLMVFRIIAIPPNLAGTTEAPPAPRVLFQIMIHVAGFILVALLVSFLAESLRTARSRLEEEKERARQLVALTDHVVRSVSSGIVAADLDGNLLQINPAGAKILGIADPERVTGRPLDEIMPIDGHNWGLLRSRVGAGAPTRLDGHLSTTGARLGLTAGPLRDEKATAVGFILNFQDLTEAEVESERQRTQERMAAIGEMAARMAHEIKNPLAAISGSAQVLASTRGVSDSDDRLLRIVVDESRRLSAILDGFLDYVRPRPASHAACDLAAVLRDCTELLRSSLEHKERHHITLDTPDELTVVGNEHHLRQIFWNLSKNALQAMPDGGTLKISADRGASSVILRWVDNGVGMPEDIRKRALEPFVTSQSGGTGLGLAVTYAAVEEHGGSIDILSRPGEGTTVTVELPITEEP